jgi:hypothetical protein
MAKTDEEVVALAGKMLALSTDHKLTLAVMLIQSDRIDVAERCIEAALDDIRAKRLLGITRAPLTRKG